MSTRTADVATSSGSPDSTGRAAEIIAITSGKGGTGKTIVSACLGYALTQAGHRVLLVDADTSTDGLSHLILGPRGVEESRHFELKNTFSAALLVPTSDGPLDIQPRRINRSATTDHGVIYHALISGRGLYGDSPPSVQVDRQAFRSGVARLFDTLLESNQYDYIIVDTQGGFSFETTDVCALAQSFIVVLEADYTSFYQARNLVHEVSAAATELKRRPILRSIIVNKAAERSSGAGVFDLANLEVAFRVELVREFEHVGLTFDATHPLVLDTEVLKAYKTQLMPLRYRSAYKFSYSVLAAFAQILKIVTSPWTPEQARAWNTLVDSVNEVIAEEHRRFLAGEEEKIKRQEELVRLRDEVAGLRTEITHRDSQLQDTTDRYEREIARTQLVIESLSPTVRVSPAPVTPPPERRMTGSSTSVVLAILVVLIVGFWMALPSLQTSPQSTIGATPTPVQTTPYVATLPPPQSGTVIVPVANLTSVPATTATGATMATGAIASATGTVAPSPTAAQAATQWQTLANSGERQGEVRFPRGLALDGAGNLLIADTENHRIVKLSTNGEFREQWGSVGSGLGQFMRPLGVAVDGAGSIFVVEAQYARVQQFTSNGRPLNQWGSVGMNGGQFFNPAGIAVDATGNIYVADTDNHRIQKLSASGAPLEGWGGSGSEPGAYNRPNGIALDRNGNIYVADTGNHRIQKLSPAGEPLEQWGASGGNPGQFRRPNGVAVDAQGNIYVADTDNHRIQKLAPTGEVTARWGTVQGSLPGQFNAPTGIAVDEIGAIYVADSENYRVQKLPAPGASAN